MKMRRLRLAAIGILIAALSAGASSAQTRTAPPQETSAAAPAGNADKGKTLFRKAGCYQCHSEQAQGGAQGPRLGPNPIAFQAFARYLRAPRGEMPPYTVKVMSDQDVADVYAFLRALPPAPPLSSLPLLQP
jgi:ubiquinol-cytochrome c reductase cytochrome c subunit